MSERSTGEFDDPEASYRRGYQHGAKAALEATGRVTIDKLREWAAVKLPNWRYHDRPGQRLVLPPDPT